jgi:hypothetical protein
MTIKNKGNCLKKIENTPLWVNLAYASIHQRKTALWLNVTNILFGLYCLPWPQFNSQPLIAKVSLINDWSWAASMLALVIWYWLAFRWVDEHQGWES